MRSFVCSAILLALSLSPDSAHAGNSQAVAVSFPATGVPPGFDDLARSRDVLVDIYFGGRRLGSVMASAQPGSLRFHNPSEAAGLLPNVAEPGSLEIALTGDLPTNAALVCSQTNSDDCGKLPPGIVGIIFDEARFRVDLFVSPRLLNTKAPDDEEYLSSTNSTLSLASSFGGALSGSSAGPTVYNFQNRTIVGMGNARLRSDTSLASGLGMIVDDFVVELDHPGRRYSAGLFWAPGSDFTGQRRIAGIGVGTQFDTRADRETLAGTPMVLFLAQPARVDLLVDGRLIATRSYEAGNNKIDTSGLPDGSYSLLLRIHEGGSIREERRFFMKSMRVPPVGRPVYYAYAGLLANTQSNRPVSLSKSLFYQIGTARRLSSRFAVEAAVIGTQKKAIVEAGAWLLAGSTRLRVAALASTSGDSGIVAQLGSTSRGSLNFNFDLRQVWSGDGGALIPSSSLVDSFGSTRPTSAQTGRGSYTQASGNIGYRLGSAYLALNGSYRKDEGQESDYSVGPSVLWPIFTNDRVQLTLHADAQRTPTSTSTFLGLRMLVRSGRFSVLSTAAHGSFKSRDGSRRSSSKGLASLNGQWHHQAEDRTQLSFDAGYDRGRHSTTAQAGGSVYSRFGSARGDIRYDLKGGNSAHYGLTIQSGAAIAGGQVLVGGRDLNESAVIATVDGSAGDSTFELLVDEAPRGRLRGGGSLAVFLQPYRSYTVRLRPVQSAPVDYDSSAKEITLYPGNVQQLRWQADAILTIFGRAVRADGKPVADALVQSGRSVGQSDDSGYFQIEVAANDTLLFTAEGRACRVQVGKIASQADYAPIGNVLCL